MRKPCLCTQNAASLQYFNYLTFCVSYTSSVELYCIPNCYVASCTISKSFIDTLCLDKKLLNFKV